MLALWEWALPLHANADDDSDDEDAETDGASDSDDDCSFDGLWVTSAVPNLRSPGAVHPDTTGM